MQVPWLQLTVLTTQYAGPDLSWPGRALAQGSGFSDSDSVFPEPNNTGAHTSQVLLCQVLEWNSEWGPRSTASPRLGAR